MLIASKMQEVYPLKIKTVFEKIAHRKLSIDELLETEDKIMKSLDYKVNTWSFFDLAMLKIAIFTNRIEEERQTLKQIEINSK